MKLLFKTFILLFFCIVTNGLYANEPTVNKIDSLDECIVTLKDGSTLIGKIISSNSVDIKLQTTSGVITINQSNIVSIVLKKNAIKYNNYNQNYNSTYERLSNYDKLTTIEVNHKYFWNNNYMGIKKNEFYFQNIWVLYNGLDYGISDNFSIGGGLLFLGVAGFVNIHARAQIELTENFSMGLAYNYFVASTFYNFNDRPANLGFMSGGFTYGNAKANISVSGGKFQVPNDRGNSFITNPSKMGLILCGSVKLGSNLNLITDNILMDKTINLNCLGMRISSTKSTFDFGMMSFGNGNIRESSLNLIPYLAMNYKIR
jgi:hypothetical protein